VKANQSIPEVLIIGAGMAGLACAASLQKAGLSFQILEGSDDVGGRVRTDFHEGYLLDRGFQVLLTSYPNTRQLLDLDLLKIHGMVPGAKIWCDSRFHTIADPLRNSKHRLESVTSGSIGTFADKLKLALLGISLRQETADHLLTELTQSNAKMNKTSTQDYLNDLGFSVQIIERFFRPFLSGVFLEKELGTSASFFRFVIKMFIEGETGVPLNGMGEIPKQLASRFDPSSIRLNSIIEEVQENQVRLKSGEVFKAKRIVIATDAENAVRLLNKSVSQKSSPWKATAQIYFEAPKGMLDEPILHLNGEGRGPVNHFIALDQVSPNYSTTGHSLVSVNVIGIPSQPEKAWLKSVRDHLETLLGPDVKTWKVLKTYKIKNALNSFAPKEISESSSKKKPFPNWLLSCGDYLETPSIEGAVISGQKAAARILESS
jgi:phytoene dehydrogenase-like protein